MAFANIFAENAEVLFSEHVVSIVVGRDQSQDGVEQVYAVLLGIERAHLELGQHVLVRGDSFSSQGVSEERTPRVDSDLVVLALQDLFITTQVFIDQQFGHEVQIGKGIVDGKKVKK